MFYARPEFCTDNGAMIAYAGMVRLNAGATADLSVSVHAGRWQSCRKLDRGSRLSGGRRLHPDLKHLVLDDQRVKLAIVLYVQLFHRPTLCALTVLMLKCINCAISFKFNPLQIRRSTSISRGEFLHVRLFMTEKHINQLVFDINLAFQDRGNRPA